jgi:hypothetical protein
MFGKRQRPQLGDHRVMTSRHRPRGAGPSPHGGGWTEPAASSRSISPGTRPACFAQHLSPPRPPIAMKKLNRELYQNVVVSCVLQRVEITRYPDRHFWHRGYDKANNEAYAQRAPARTMRAGDRRPPTGCAIMLLFATRCRDIAEYSLPKFSACAIVRIPVLRQEVCLLQRTGDNEFGQVQQDKKN